MNEKQSQPHDEAQAGQSLAASGLFGLQQQCPAYRHMSFVVQIGDPMSECINLLSQAMLSYPELKPKGQQAVAAWFTKAYGE